MSGGLSEAGDYLDVVATPRGQIYAAWQEDRNGKQAIIMATRTPGGVWSGPDLMSSPDEIAERPSLAVGPDGYVALAWMARGGPGGTDTEIVLRTKGAAKGWGTQRYLTDNTTIDYDPSVAISPDHRVAVGWQNTGLSQTMTMILDADDGRILQPVTPIGSGAAQPRMVQVAWGSGGHLWAAWTEYLNGEATMPMARYVDGSGWRVVAEPSGKDSGYESSCTLKVDAKGRAFGTWLTAGPDKLTFTVGFVRATPAGAVSVGEFITEWGSSLALLPGGRAIGAATNATGAFTVLWNGTTWKQEPVYGSVTTKALPALATDPAEVRKPGRATTVDKARYRVLWSGRDRWTDQVTFRVQRRIGTAKWKRFAWNVTDTAKATRLARGQKQCFRVRATDNVANRSTWSKPRCVTRRR